MAGAARLEIARLPTSGLAKTNERELPVSFRAQSPRAVSVAAEVTEVQRCLA